MSDGLIIGNIENLKRLSCALCKTRIHNSQLCVLLIVALSPGTTMRMIVVETHLSEQAVCNLLRRLADMGDITFTECRESGRRYFLTLQGARVVKSASRISD